MNMNIISGVSFSNICSLFSASVSLSLHPLIFSPFSCTPLSFPTLLSHTSPVPLYQRTLCSILLLIPLFSILYPPISPRFSLSSTFSTNHYFLTLFTNYPSCLPIFTTHHTLYLQRQRTHSLTIFNLTSSSTFEVFNFHIYFAD